MSLYKDCLQIFNIPELLLGTNHQLTSPDFRVRRVIDVSVELQQRLGVILTLHLVEGDDPLLIRRAFLVILVHDEHVVV